MNIKRLIAAAFALLSANCGLPAANSDTEPAAPTIPDAHEFFQSVVSKNGISALYNARQDGILIGYVVYPVLHYKGSSCSSGLALSNGDKIDIDWKLAGKPEGRDGQIGIWRSPNTVYESAHLISIEGGVDAEPAKNIARFTLSINDELSRNRLLKAMDLLSSSCRSKSKFD